MAWSMASRRKRVNPATSAIALAFDSGSPRVPRPAPPGSDSADERHDITETPYMSVATGVLATFSAEASLALMSTSSQVPSSRSAGSDGLDHLLWTGHVVEAVECGHQVDRAVRRKWITPGHRGSGRWPGRGPVGAAGAVQRQA